MKNLVPSKKRNKNDYYPTAPIATLGLLENVEVPKRILEPFSGRGWISKVLVDHDHDVIARDLYHYDDTFVDTEFDLDAFKQDRADVDGVVTNPPYGRGIPLKILQKYIHEYDFIAFFCRLNFLETPSRGEFFTQYPMHKCIVMSTRIQCNEKYFNALSNQTGGMVQYAWFVWDKNKKSSNELMFYDAKKIIEEKQNTLESFL